MVALYITQDSFGTACNISGDNAIGVIVETIYRRFIMQRPLSSKEQSPCPLSVFLMCWDRT